MVKAIPRIITWIVGGIVVGILFAFLFGWLVMLLWNWIIPPVFGLTTITFWQAWGLVILTHILFKCGPGHHNGHPFLHHPFHKHPEEWRDRFKCKLKEHFEACKEKHAEKNEE
jgi:hypothetical protein